MIDSDLERKLKNLKLIEPTLTPSDRLSIISYELGPIIKWGLYSRRFPEIKLPSKNIELKIANVITMLYFLCIDLGLNWKKIRELGYKHLVERYKDFKEDRWEKLK